VRVEECREISGKSSPILPQAFLEAGPSARWGAGGEKRRGGFVGGVRNFHQGVDVNFFFKKTPLMERI
jgi:hypothetical protein